MPVPVAYTISGCYGPKEKTHHASDSGTRLGPGGAPGWPPVLVALRLRLRLAAAGEWRSGSGWQPTATGRLRR